MKYYIQKLYKMKTIREVYGKPIAATSGYLSERKYSNCWKTAEKLGFDCFAVAGARAGRRWNDGYMIYFFRGVKPEGKQSFRGIIQF